MLTKRTNIKKGTSKILLIILGVLVALLMTLTSPLFAAENLMATIPRNLKQAEPAADNFSPNDQVDLNENLRLQSSARLFQIFTGNLPFLNHK